MTISTSFTVAQILTQIIKLSYFNVLETIKALEEHLKFVHRQFVSPQLRTKKKRSF